MKNKVICVYNNQKLYDTLVKANKNLESCEIIGYNNTKTNTAITKLYNNFIDKYVDESQKDFWCFFIHQDFGFMEDINLIIQRLDPNFVFGTIGIKFNDEFSFKRDESSSPENKIPISSTVGQILQGDNGLNFHSYGVKLEEPQIANAIDCCCIILHSSLIKKYNLHFDENLKFHMYAEDICYKAKSEYGIETKVVPTKCFHIGQGSLNKDFQEAAQYLKDKYDLDMVPSTCPN